MLTEGAKQMIDLWTGALTFPAKPRLAKQLHNTA
jgi:hypothetical protein